MAIPVKVAVRCRPLTQKEEDQGNLLCVHFPANEPMIVIGKKPFTFNYVFSPDTQQDTIYEETVRPLIDKILEGYNATVFAYGQTGSGKTYTMGGTCDGTDINESVGIMPRVLAEIFNRFSEKDTHEFIATVSYLEIYNEEVRDLLSSNRKDPLHVREDSTGIKIPGLTLVSVKNYESTMKCLENGILGRSVASTAMNSVSSRSHAIFSFHAEITNKSDHNECFKSKLHLVDLAGSERIKKTQAEGSRMKEGININKGLLCLGNVISSLGEESKHIPYRDSKLTRLLQDSLGGNSYTVMIACISPADSNMEESLNTLRYADRAGKIKNKPLVNHDPRVAELISLKNQVTQLQMELISVTGNANNTQCYQELVARVKELEKQNKSLTEELNASLERGAQQLEQIIKAEAQNEDQKNKLETVLAICRKLSEKNNPDDEDTHKLKEQFESVQNAVETQVNDTKIECGETSLEEADQSLGDDYMNTSEAQQLTTQHALKQAVLSRELGELNAILTKKQKLAAQMAQTNLQEITAQFETDKIELQNKIDALMKEKAVLESALSSAKTTKQSETRVQKIRELEQKVLQLQKERAEKEHALKTKEPLESRVSNLNAEIRNMKTQRVKIMKQMKEESDSFRKWKLQKDKEVNKLMQKDRKRQFEIQKLMAANEKQQGILKRKSEEASAANKRLKEALSKQKAVRLDRQREFENYGASKNAQSLKLILEREIDVKVSLRETKHYLQTLIADRILLHSQLKDLKAELNEPPKKKHSGNNSKINDSFYRKELEEQIKILNEDIKVRNIQITEIQNKIQDGESDKAKPCWETLHSMNEAKLFLKILFEKSVGEKVKTLIMSGELKGVQQEKEEQEARLEKKATEIESLANVYEAEKTNILQKHENKVLRLLKQLRRFTNEDPNVTIDEETKFKVEKQESYEEIITNLKSQIESKDAEIGTLKSTMENGFHTPDLFADVSDSTDPDWTITPYVKKARTVLTKTCRCKLGCRSAKCTCVKKNQPCGSLCLCQGNCYNMASKEKGTSDDEADDDADDNADNDGNNDEDMDTYSKSLSTRLFS